MIDCSVVRIDASAEKPYLYTAVMTSCAAARCVGVSFTFEPLGRVLSKGCKLNGSKAYCFRLETYTAVGCGMTQLKWASVDRSTGYWLNTSSMTIVVVFWPKLSTLRYVWGHTYIISAGLKPAAKTPFSESNINT